MDEAAFGERLHQELERRGTNRPQPSRLWVPADGSFVSDSYGPDYFGLRKHGPAPYHLQGYPYRRLPTSKYAAFLNELSLTKPRPDPEAFKAALQPENLAEARVLVGPVPTVDGVRWVTPMYDGSPSDPTLPTDDRGVEMALIRHAVWVGSPLGVTGAMGKFRRKVGQAARLMRRHGITTVLWTDISREVAERARSGTENVFEGHDLAAIRSLLMWAMAHDISLVDHREVYHVEHPMRLREEAVTAHARLQGQGFAGESDNIRPAPMWDFGGFYADGDTVIGRDVIKDLRATLVSDYGFTKYVTETYESGWREISVENVTLIGPAGHEGTRRVQDSMRLGYAMTQPDALPGGMSQGFGGEGVTQSTTGSDPLQQ